MAQKLEMSDRNHGITVEGMQEQETRLEEEMLKRVFPLEIKVHHSETYTFTIATALGVTYGVVSGIRVQDVSTGKWYNWDRPGPFVPTPVCNPGPMNLYIAFWAVNQGVAGNITLTIKDDTGATLATKTEYCAYGGAGVGIEWTGDMPGRNYAITLTVTP